MREITWLEGNASRAGKDVEVRVYVEKNEKYTRCTFYGTSVVKVTRKDHMKIGLSGNRIYFDEAYDKGYKISRSGKNMYVRMPGVKPDWAGDYKLNYDAELKLWYIERRTK